MEREWVLHSDAVCTYEGCSCCGEWVEVVTLETLLALPAQLDPDPGTTLEGDIVGQLMHGALVDAVQAQRERKN